MGGKATPRASAFWMNCCLIRLTSCHSGELQTKRSITAALLRKAWSQDCELIILMDYVILSVTSGDCRKDWGSRVPEIARNAFTRLWKRFFQKAKSCPGTGRSVGLPDTIF